MAKQKSNTDRVIATVSPRSAGGVSMFETTERITPENVGQFASEDAVVAEAVRELEGEGFEVLQVSPTTLSIAGTPKQFEDTFGVKLKKEKKEVIEGQEAVEFFAVAESEGGAGLALQTPERLSGLIEGAAIAVPPEYCAASPIPPLARPVAGAYRYLFAPDDVALITNAARVHRLGTTGKGVKVAMIDSGQYAHPFFNRHGYRVKQTVLGPGAADPSKDDSGHGTGESANIFATAPDVELIPVKMAADSTGAFNAAVARSPHVISCSWVYNVDSVSWSTLKNEELNLYNYLRTLEAAVASAVASGIVVCFAAGNGHRAFPASHPDVIAVGGAHVNYPSLDLEASSYASSFRSSLYPGRNVPDVCGLVGKNVGGAAPLVMLPVQPGANLDLGNTGATDDGWGLFSGTSAACPQVAGIVALLLQKKPALTPAKVKEILMKSAIDVKAGQTAMGDAAGVGADLATGAGLANAKWAWIITMGNVTAEFFAAAPELQQEMLGNGGMPPVTQEMIDEMISTLRTVH